MRNYPKLSGFWIDNDNEYWEQHQLYEQIPQLRPDMTLRQQRGHPDHGHGVP